MIEIIRKISDNLSEFTQLELVVAKNIIETPYLVVECNITDLAEKLTVSRNTVTRFCKKIGFHGYAEFAYAMEEQLKSNTKDSLVEVTTHDYITSAYISTIQKMGNYISEEEFISLAERIMHSKNVKVIATGKSYAAATQMCYRFQTVQKHIQVIDHVDAYKDSSFLFEKDDLVLVFSQSGKSRFTNLIMHAAQKKTKQTVLFTMSQHVDAPEMYKYILPSVANTKQLYTNDNISIFMVFIEILMAYYVKIS